MVFSKSAIKRGVTVFALSAALVAGSAGSAFAYTAKSNLWIGGSTTIAPLATLLQNAYHKSYPKVTFKAVASVGSGAGISGTKNGTYDIGMSSNALASSDLATLNQYAIGRDAVTFITSTKNKVKNLTKTQLVNIYKGTIANWKDVGGANAKINVYGRAAGSGTAEYVNKNIFGSVLLTSALKTKTSSQLIKNAVAADPNGIGYVGMSFATGTVRGLSIGGVAPTRTNAVAGKYPFVRQLFLLTTKSGFTGANAEFINWTLGSKGQTIVGSIYIKLH
jgi:phosphate transport system substrate-binding protein